MKTSSETVVTIVEWGMTTKDTSVIAECVTGIQSLGGCVRDFVTASKGLHLYSL